MKNITKLSSWNKLQSLGFIPIKYKSHGKLMHIGASLRYDNIESDKITIEPCNTNDGLNYKISSYGVVHWVNARNILSMVNYFLNRIDSNIN